MWLQTLLYSLLGEYLYMFLLVTCVRVELLCHRLCLMSVDAAHSFPKWLYSHSYQQQFPVASHAHPHLMSSVLLILSFLVNWGWYHIIVLIFISLFCVAELSEHHFICLLVIWRSTLMLDLCKSSACFPIGLPVFLLLICRCSLYTEDTSALSDIYIADIFSLSVNCFYHSLNRLFWGSWTHSWGWYSVNSNWETMILTSQLMTKNRACCVESLDLSEHCWNLVSSFVNEVRFAHPFGSLVLKSYSSLAWGWQLEMVNSIRWGAVVSRRWWWTVKG